LNELLSSDYLLTKEEGQQLLKLQVGLDQKKSSGFTENVNVLSRLKSENLEGYYEVCFEIGWDFLSNYDTEIDRDRYANAAKWFELMKSSGTDNAAIASIFYDISECTNKINQLHGGKVIQTQELKEQRENLWKMVQSLQTKAEKYDLDYRVQVWTEIDGLIYNNVADFLEVVEIEELTTMLGEIKTNVESIDKSNPDIAEFASKLQQSITETINKIETAKK